MLLTKQTSKMSRRRFLQVTAMSGSAALFAACNGNEPTSPAAPTTAPVPTDEPTATVEPTEAEAPVEASMELANDAEIIAKDVIDFTLHSDEWVTDFGSVTFRMHEVMYNGESAYLIRTDASEPNYAETEGLVYVPLLNTAAGMDVTNTLYTFSDGRPPVIGMIPGDEGYSSLFAVKAIMVDDSALTLDSMENVMAAIDDGAISVEESTPLFVNHPLIKWPGGELTVDPDLNGPPLMNGQLFDVPDTSAMEVTMKLHKCYPGSRYIVTDAGMMASMMNVSDAAPTNQLKELGGTDEIWVFGNGIPGPGVMGFQPAIFDNNAGEPAWSPFWDHFTVTWKDEASARLLTNSEELRAALEAEELELFNGVPDSHPTGFVVNCPAPILATNDFMPA